MIKITFPDGSVREYEEGITPLEIAKSISRRLAEEVLAASVNDETWDLTRPITEDATLKLLMGRRRRQTCVLAFVGSPHGRSIAGVVSGN